MAHGPEMLGWETPGGTLRLTQHLRRGAIVALPTETLFGLSCIATDADAVARLAAVKGTSRARGFVALLARFEMIEPWLVPGNDPRGLALLRRIWPAPLSAILAVQADLPWGEPGDPPTAAFRVPSHPALLRLLECVDAPVVSTSVNRAGEPPLGDAAAIAALFGSCLAAIVLERPHERPASAASRRASTLADFRSWPPAVRRQGSYDLAAALASGEPDRAEA